MKETESGGLASSDGCGAGKNADGSATGGVAAGRGVPRERRPWIKMVVVAVILFAALGVGAHSLITSRDASQTGQMSPTPSSSETLAAPTSPTLNPPSCCGGAAHGNAKGEATCGGGGGAAVSATSSGGTPTCGCGH